MTSYDVKWRHLTRHLRFAILNFTFFLKSQEITKIDTKSSQNAYEMYKLVNCWNLMRKTEKYRIMSKKSIFGQTHMKLAVAMETSKWWTHHWHIKISGPRRMNEQLLKVSAPKSKSSFQNFEKTLLRGWHPSPPSPLSVRGLRDIASIELPLPQIIFKDFVYDIKIEITLINWFYNI